MRIYTARATVKKHYFTRDQLAEILRLYRHALDQEVKRVKGELYRYIITGYKVTRYIYIKDERPCPAVLIPPACYSPSIRYHYSGDFALAA